MVYDNAGRKTLSQQANGTKASMAYDAANRMNQVVNLKSTNTTLSYYNYGFDRIGDRTSIWDNGTDVSNWNYDLTGQLTNDVIHPATTALTWYGLTIDQWNLLSVSGWDGLLVDAVPIGGAGLLAYDPAGNRLTQIDPVTGDITTFIYDNGNRLTRATDISGITTRTYDANGNQLTIEEPSGDITTNTWDGENRLVEVHHPLGDIVTYAYNGDGLRVFQDDGVDEIRYVHDGNNVLLETDGVGTIEAEFTYIPQVYAQVISQLRTGASSFYQFDGTKNVRQLTDSSQVVTDDYAFDAWGVLRSSTGSTANSQLWKGQFLAYRKDPDAGPEVQYAMHHRNYDPKTGVFTSADPAKEDRNLYRYVNNNPVNRADPRGLEDEEQRRIRQKVQERGYWGWLQREYWSALRWQDGYKQLDHWTQVLDRTTDPYVAARARENIQTARQQIQSYTIDIERDAAAERAVQSATQRGQTPPPQNGEVAGGEGHFSLREIDPTIDIVEEGTKGFVKVYRTKTPSGAFEVAYRYLGGVQQFEREDVPWLIIEYSRLEEFAEAARRLGCPPTPQCRVVE